MEALALSIHYVVIILFMQRMYKKLNSIPDMMKMYNLTKLLKYVTTRPSLKFKLYIIHHQGPNNLGMAIFLLQMDLKIWKNIQLAANY